MEQSDRPLTRDALVSMQVIDAKGRLIGRVKDVNFEIGKLGISISVEKSDGSVENISWDAVQAATDFILLKPQVQTQAQFQPQVQFQPQPQVQQPAQPLCPTCGKPLTWIPQYKRWYCYNDKKYV
jgi:sporulation protein YlmC with PRC-barrel domain